LTFGLQLLAIEAGIIGALLEGEGRRVEAQVQVQVQVGSGQ
jgi:hypothetical protein